ncbi:MAG: hypothetical protein QW260_06175 [Thermoproteota archaeon]
MGQYWLICNFDKKEFVSPDRLGAGYKLWECLANPGPGAALIILLAAEREVRGGGDLDLDTPGAAEVIGRWAGDRVALVGDYAEDSDLPPEWQAGSIWDKCMAGEEWRDITPLLYPVFRQEIPRKEWVSYLPTIGSREASPSP